MEVWCNGGIVYGELVYRRVDVEESWGKIMLM
jgi:hypothetical protein